MTTDGTLLLTSSDVSELLTIEECLIAVEQAFKMVGQGKTTPPGILGVHAEDGGFHIKAGLMDLDRSYFAAKVNANFPNNAKRCGLPTIQGVVVLCDGKNGYPLALIDSIELTIRRTGAATGVAAKHLARQDSRLATIIGCGNQGRISLHALSNVLPIEKVWAYDLDYTRAQDFANRLSGELQVKVEPVIDFEPLIARSDVCVTCTPSKRPFLKSDLIAPGTFIAAVGADNPEKQELEASLLSGNKVVADLLEQCATIGEVHHALDAGLITRDDIYGELGEVVAGIKPGRTSDAEIIIFDSTGMALQDVVAAAAVYEKAVAKAVGARLDFAA